MVVCVSDLSDFIYPVLGISVALQALTAGFVLNIWGKLSDAEEPEPAAPTEVHPAAIEAATEAVQEKFEAVMTPRRRKSLRRQATLEKGLSERRKLEEWRD